MIYDTAGAIPAMRAMLTVTAPVTERASRRARRPGRDQSPLGCPAADASPVGRTEPTGGGGDRAVWGSRDRAPCAWQTDQDRAPRSRPEPPPPCAKYRGGGGLPQTTDPC